MLSKILTIIKGLFIMGTVAKLLPRKQRVSMAGLNHIIAFEGFSPNVYQDAGGLDKKGYGHLLKDDEKESGVFNSGITKQSASLLLRGDIAIAENDVNRHTNVLLTQNQFDALVSWVFNIGGGAFVRSTLLKKLNNDDYAGASDQFKRWDKVNGRKVSGLSRRRESEFNLFWA